MKFWPEVMTEIDSSNWPQEEENKRKSMIAESNGRIGNGVQGPIL
jgi:hypothetical protein